MDDEGGAVSNDSDDLSLKTETGAVERARAAEAALGGQDDLFGPGGVIDIQSPARIAEIIDKKSQPTIAELLSGSPWRGGDFDLDIAEFARLILIDRDQIHSAFTSSIDSNSKIFSIIDDALDAVFDTLDDMMGRPCQPQIFELTDEIKTLRQIAQPTVSGAATSDHLFAHGSKHMTRLAFYRACCGVRADQLDMSSFAHDLLSFSNTNTLNERFFCAALGWMDSLATIKSNDGPIRPYLVICAGEVVLSNLKKFIGPARSAALLGIGYDETLKIAGTKRVHLGRALPAEPADPPVDPPVEVEKETGPGVVIMTSIIEFSDDRSRNVRQYKAVVGKRFALFQTPNLTEVRSVLLYEFPHAKRIVDNILNDISMRRDEGGRAYVWFRPTLLVGNPGCGKSRFARRLAELLGIPHMLFGAAGVADSMFGSNSRKWGGSGPSLPVQTMIQNSIANPVIILDEIDKAQRSHNGSLEDTLLPMLERSTAASRPSE